MRGFILLLGGLALFSTTGCGSSPTVDRVAEEDRLRSIMQRINEAWQSEDLETLAGLVGRDADMTNFGPDINENWTGWEAFSKGLQQQFLWCLYRIAQRYVGQVLLNTSHAGKRE